MKHPSLLMLCFTLLIVSTSLAIAETHIIEMRNADTTDSNHLNVFTPPILRIAKGDTIKFVAVDAAHNSASKKGMIPEGATPWNGAIDEEIEITLDVEGTYGYLCLPHYEMGMVGLILVGDYTSNYKQAKKVRHLSKAKKVFRKLFKQIEEEEKTTQNKHLDKPSDPSCPAVK